MAAQSWVKTDRSRIVAVIASRADLERAVRVRKPPDFFELRLDCLSGSIDRHKLSMLPAQLIITARDPREGGVNNLPIQKRRKLLQRFLPCATLIDVELRSFTAFKSIVNLARKQDVGVILSFHNFESTPSLGILHAIARKAKSMGADILKIATRTDTSEALSRLVDFIQSKGVDLPVSAMGIGKLGCKSRLELMRRGSVLNYCSLSRANVTGQPTLSQIRRWTLGTRRGGGLRRRVQRSTFS
jgi:3-dehydroquinate dehydratase I